MNNMYLQLMDLVHRAMMMHYLLKSNYQISRKRENVSALESIYQMLMSMSLQVL